MWNRALFAVMVVLLLLLCLLYRKVTKHFRKWSQLGIAHVPGHFPFGSYKEFFLGKEHLLNLAKQDYQRFHDQDYYGWFLLGKPVLAIRNIELIKQILIKDFAHFVDRTNPDITQLFSGGGELDKLWRNQLTNLNGEDWKLVRSTFSPIFTSGKMKAMLRFILKVGDNLVDEFGQKADQGEDFQLKSVFGKFSLDTLASCALGVDAESFANSGSPFVKHADNIFRRSKREFFLLVARTMPGISHVLNHFRLNLFKPTETRFFRDIVRHTMKQRRATGERRNDLIDLMLDCVKEEEEGGPIETRHLKEEEGEDQYERDMRLMSSARHVSANGGKTTGGLHQIEEDIVVATAMIFMVAGYDTTGLTLSFVAYELARHPAAQARLQAEVDAAVAAADGQLPDYDVVQSGMPYLESVILETLRLHSPLGFMVRTCTTQYRIPHTNILLRPNDMISFSIAGIHSDPAHYPDPDTFRPDNFSKEARNNRSPYTFLAFGQGPRACIGMRFALLEAKVALIQVLSKFTFLESEKNPEQLELDPLSNLAAARGGLWARIRRRSADQ